MLSSTSSAAERATLPLASPPRARARLRRLAAVLVWPARLVVLLLVATLGVRAWAPVSSSSAALVAATPAVAGAALVASACLLLGRRGDRLAAALAVVAVVATQHALVPVARHQATGTGSPLVMMSANLELGGADADAVVQLVRRRSVDVLAVQELTPQEVARLRLAGLDRELPYALLRPGPTATGCGLWSRYPLQAAPGPSGLAFHPVAASLRPTGSTTSVTVASVHITAPWPAPAGTWAAELARLRTWLSGLGGAAAVAGDFNATLDHRQFRALLTRGYHDAAVSTGDAWRRTFPSSGIVPPAVTIDHVLVRGEVRPRSVTTAYVPGSDHRAVLSSLDAGLQAS